MFAFVDRLLSTVFDSDKIIIEDIVDNEGGSSKFVGEEIVKRGKKKADLRCYKRNNFKKGLCRGYREKSTHFPYLFIGGKDNLAMSFT